MKRLVVFGKNKKATAIVYFILRFSESAPLGRIAFAASNGKSGMLQIAWLLQKLGWRYMYYVGGSFYADDEFQPTIYLYGNRVCGAEYQTAKYLLTFDAKQ